MNQLRRLVPLVLLGLLHVAPAPAQDDGVLYDHRLTNRPPISELLPQYAEEVRTGTMGHTAQRYVSYLLWNVDSLSHATADSLLAGLEEIALTADDERVRMAAAGRVTMLVQEPVPQSIPNPMERVLRLYQRGSEEVRFAITGRMAWVADRFQPEAIAFLSSVAQQPVEGEDFEGAAWNAVSTLSAMGEAGRAALIELDRSGQLRAPRARGYVEWIARNDYRRTSGRKVEPKTDW